MKTMLDERAKTLLKTLVERYIADGQPVGSRTLSRASGLELSPATIRNVMADLEELGLIASPHTSAGRIPTARGYRLFVDTMLTARPLDLDPAAPDMRAAREQLHPDQPQRVIAQAAQLLSSLSSFVGVVTAPRKASVFHHIEFLRLGERRVLVILVAPDGDVQNRVIFTARDYAQGELVEATNYLNTHYAGLSIEGVRERLKHEIEALRTEIATLMQAAVQAGTEVLAESSDQVIVSGERKLLDVPALAKGHSFYRVGEKALSPNGRLLAWAEDTTGRRIHTLRLKDLRTGQLLADTVSGVLEEVVWAEDNRTLFYVLQDPVTLQSGCLNAHFSAMVGSSQSYGGSKITLFQVTLTPVGGGPIAMHGHYPTPYGLASPAVALTAEYDVDMLGSNFYMPVGQGEGYVPPGNYRVDVWWTGGPFAPVGSIGAAFVQDIDAQQAAVLGATPAALIAAAPDLGALQQDFALQAAPDADGLQWVQATPKRRDGQLQSVRVGFRGDAPHAGHRLPNVGRGAHARHQPGAGQARQRAGLDPGYAGHFAAGLASAARGCQQVQRWLIRDSAIDAAWFDRHDVSGTGASASAGPSGCDQQRCLFARWHERAHGQR